MSDMEMFPRVATIVEDERAVYVHVRPPMSDAEAERLVGFSDGYHGSVSVAGAAIQYGWDERGNSPNTAFPFWRSHPAVRDPARFGHFIDAFIQQIAATNVQDNRGQASSFAA